MANNANTQLKEELGEGYEDVDWRKLDPRQYDPRRIIREALLEDLPDSSVELPRVKTTPRLAKGEDAPFDSEAT